MNKFIPLYFTLEDENTFQLAKTINTDKYLCGISYLEGKVVTPSYKKSDRLFLCSDVCQESYVNSIKLPILCEIYRNKKNGTVINEIYNITWLRILRPNISSVKLYICDEEGSTVSFWTGQLRCSLLFIYSP